MKRATIVALAWLAFVVGVLLFYSGCSKQIPTCPTPTAAYTDGWCAAGTRKGVDFVFCTPTRELCQYAVDRASAFNAVAGLGIESLSGCGRADVSVVVKEIETRP